MALFKISKGTKSNLNNQTLTEGYCWFTPEDGKFYIDAFKNEVLTRIPLNAAVADSVAWTNVTGRPGNATSTKGGILTDAQAVKLAGIATGAEVNQNAFSNIKIGSTTVAADAKTDTVEFTGSNITISGDATNDKVTFSLTQANVTAALGYTPPTTNTTYDVATQSASGLMSSDDKTKLNGIATGAEVNQNAFSNIKVGSTTVAADAKTDTVEFVGSNVTITPDATNDKVTFSLTSSNVTTALGYTPPQQDTTYSAATQSAAGLMSAADKKKLDGIATGAQVNVLESVTASGTAPLTLSAGAITNKTIAISGAIADATTSTKGVVKIGDGISVNNGIISVTASGLGLSSAMLFKGSLGTGGTITSLPAAAAGNTGYTYKVITAGTYASQAAKVGDVFVSDGSSWVLIPSGDEPSGTVTSVGISNATNGGLTVTSSPITTSGTISIGHTNVLTNAQTTQALYPIKIDKNGHISAYGTAVTSLPASDVSAWAKAATKPTYNWGEISQSGANNIEEGTADFTDNTELFSSYASNNGFADTNATGKVYRRDAVHMYNYVKTKLAVTNNNINLSRDTETTIATIGGTAIKIKLPASDNTNYYHKTGSWNGLTYTASKVGNPDDLAFTIPTGITATTVAVGNHTHTTSLVGDTGTATVTLAHGNTYKLTAGGTSVIFQMPNDNNTDTKVTQETTTTSSWRKVLLNGGSSNTYSGWNTAIVNVTDEIYQSQYIAVQPSTGTLAAKSFRVAGSANSSNTITSDATTNIYFNVNSKIPLVVTDTTIRSSAGSAGTIDLGTSSNKWNKVYANYFYGDGSNLTNLPTTYWANLATTSAAAYNKAPEVASIKIGNGTTATATKGVTLQYNTTTNALDFIFM